MAKPTFEDIDEDVNKALRKLVAEQFPGVDFSYSLVPSKSITEGGFGASWNGWRALLNNLKDTHLRKRPSYRKFDVGPKLVDDTLSKELTSAKIQIRNRLWMCVSN